MRPWLRLVSWKESHIQDLNKFGFKYLSIRLQASFLEASVKCKFLPTYFTFPSLEHYRWYIITDVESRKACFP